MDENEITDTPDAAPESAPASDPAPSADDGGWNLDASPIDQEPWWADLSDDARARVRSGIDGKIKAYAKGFTTKTTALAEERKRLQEEVARERKSTLQMLYGELDPVAEKDRELTTLREEMEKTRAEMESLTGKAKEEARAEYAEQLRELEELRGKAQTWEQQRQEQEARAWKEKEDAFLADLEKNAPDIFEDTDAYADYCTLIAAGRTPEVAIRMVRASLPEAPPVPPEPTPEEVPPTMRMMGSGGGGNLDVAHANRDPLSEVFRREMAKAQEEDRNRR